MQIFSLIAHNLAELYGKLTVNNKYINKLVQLFIHQTMQVSKIMCQGDKAAVTFLYKTAEVHTSASAYGIAFTSFKYCVHEIMEYNIR